MTYRAITVAITAILLSACTSHAATHTSARVAQSTPNPFAREIAQLHHAIGQSPQICVTPQTSDQIALLVHAGIVTESTQYVVGIFGGRVPVTKLTLTDSGADYVRPGTENNGRPTICVGRETVTVTSVRHSADDDTRIHYRDTGSLYPWARGAHLTQAFALRDQVNTRRCTLTVSAKGNPLDDTCHPEIVEAAQLRAAGATEAQIRAAGLLP